MPTIEELRQVRIQKLEKIKNAGENAYPITVRRTDFINLILKKFWLWNLSKKKFYIVGRVKNIRTHGKAAFFDVEDSSGKIQCFLVPADLSNFDIGDFVEVGGKFFKTKAGEKTVKVGSLKMITKSLRPTPEKWHGLKDVEERYRKRYLDLLTNNEIKEKFLKRSKIIKEIRNFFDEHGFEEFETPMLQLIPGGATARPFKTHLNALDLDLYLRIAPELFLKRLLVGGYEKIFEIGRNFRNEGMDASHNPEFTMLEAYIAYKDTDFLKIFIKELFNFLVGKLNNGNLEIEYDGKKINFKNWEEKKYSDLIKKFGDLDIAKKSLIQPTFVSEFPSAMLPLSKSLENDEERADAFQIFIGGLELVKAFAEQNDSIKQKERFEEQEKLREGGEEEAQRFDKDFIEAIEYGMPPSSGFGIGIDRLAMLLTNSHTAREIILFPTMRPKEHD